MALRLSQDEQTLIQIIRNAEKPNRVRAAVFSFLTSMPAASRTFVSKRQIKKGNGGFPCSVPGEQCSKVLSTAARAAKHATTNAELQLFGHYRG